MSATTWISDNAIVVLWAFLGLVVLVVAVVVAWLRARHVHAQDTGARIEAERDRIDLELSLAEEAGRLSIVRELHEIAISYLTRIVADADGAKYAAAGDAAAPLRVAASVADTARAALADLRRSIDVIGDVDAILDGLPGLDDLDRLYGVMRDAGLVITVEQNGVPFALKAGAEVGIYRIVQEALQNALAHGGNGTEVRVAMRWTEDGLQLLIDDDGTQATARRDGAPGAPSTSAAYSRDDDLNALTGTASGPGITEMRERTERFGGVFAAHAVPGVGFSVSAVFPVLRHHNGVHGVDLDA